MNTPSEPFANFPAVIPRRARILDLSHAINAAMPQWPGDVRSFESQTECSIVNNGYFTRSFWMLEHYGTHLDAPAHFSESGATVNTIPAHRLFGPAVILDVRDEAMRNPDYLLETDAIAEWEREHSSIPRGAIVLLRTGWSAYWPDAAHYCNQDANGTMHFPGYSEEAVRILIERKVYGIGCDTMSTDTGCSEDYPVHKLASGAGLYQIENLADLSALPESGAWLVVAPIKLEGGSGGPCRVFALLP